MTAIAASPRHALSLIDEAGTPTGESTLTLPEPAELIAAYRDLVIGRRVNDQAAALARQGRLAVYPSSHGQEACEVAAARALRPSDWLFPTYRDSVAVITRGVSAADVFVIFRGDWHGGFNPTTTHTAPLTTPLATQLLHAVGAAHAAKLRGEDTVAIALCGDGATSEGDFHEALNFAAVFGVGVVFLVQNNGYAISVPLSEQSAAEALADKAVGYGMPGVRVDGNDVAAMTAVLAEATERARRGDGPTLVEAMTYRMQAHTNADDATRYRDAAEVEAWAPRDPLLRMRHYLIERDLLSDADEAMMRADAETVAAEIRDAIANAPEANPLELFDHVYATMPPELVRQRDRLAAELAAAESAATEPAGTPSREDAR